MGPRSMCRNACNTYRLKERTDWHALSKCTLVQLCTEGSCSADQGRVAGAIQPVEEIGQLCRERKAFFHTDAAQAVGKACAQ